MDKSGQLFYRIQPDISFSVLPVILRIRGRYPSEEGSDEIKSRPRKRTRSDKETGGMPIVLRTVL